VTVKQTESDFNVSALLTNVVILVSGFHRLVVSKVTDRVND